MFVYEFLLLVHSSYLLTNLVLQSGEKRNVVLSLYVYMYVRVYTHNPFTRCIVCMRGISRLMPKFTTFPLKVIGLMGS